MARKKKEEKNEEGYTVSLSIAGKKTTTMGETIAQALCQMKVSDIRGNGTFTITKDGVDHFIPLKFSATKLRFIISRHSLVPIFAKRLQTLM